MQGRVVQVCNGGVQVGGAKGAHALGLNQLQYSLGSQTSPSPPG